MARNRKRDQQTGSRSKSPAKSQVIVDPDAYRDIEAHCAENPTQEVCGVLVGFTWSEDGMQRTRVVASVRGLHAREGQMSVTFTHETWQAVHEVVERRVDDAKVIGWYHSHPDFGVFYSSQDVFVHKHFFGDVGQLGIVVDPIREQRGAFLSTVEGIDPIRRFEVARQNSTGHLVSCAYAPEAVQESSVEATAAGGDDSPVLARLDSIEATLARLERTVRFTRTCAVMACLFVTAASAWIVLDVFMGPRPQMVGLTRDGQLILVPQVPSSPPRTGSGSTSPPATRTPDPNPPKTAPVEPKEERR